MKKRRRKKKPSVCHPNKTNNRPKTEDAQKNFLIEILHGFFALAKFLFSILISMLVACDIVEMRIGSMYRIDYPECVIVNVFNKDEDESVSCLSSLEKEILFTYQNCCQLQ